MPVLSIEPMRGWRWTRQLRQWSEQHLRAVKFALLVVLGRRSLLDPSGISEVSLTSYETRLGRVHLSIMSIGAGRARPARLTLAVGEPGFVARPTWQVRRLQRRGLSIALTDDRGPHTKYLHAVHDASMDHYCLVTADDDIFYPKGWLADLESTHRCHPADIVAHRAHHILVNGAIAAYDCWPQVLSTEPSHAHFATGVGGVLYPPAMRRELREAGTEFLDRCPKADDVWLNKIAVRSATRVRQVRDRPWEPPSVPGLGREALMVDNVAGRGNDVAIAATYDKTDVVRVAADAVRCCGVSVAM